MMFTKNFIPFFLIFSSCIYATEYKQKLHVLHLPLAEHCVAAVANEPYDLKIKDTDECFKIEL